MSETATTAEKELHKEIIQKKRIDTEDDTLSGGKRHEAACLAVKNCGLRHML